MRRNSGGRLRKVEFVTFPMIGSTQSRRSGIWAELTRPPSGSRNVWLCSIGYWITTVRQGRETYQFTCVKCNKKDTFLEQSGFRTMLEQKGWGPNALFKSRSL